MTWAGLSSIVTPKPSKDTGMGCDFPIKAYRSEQLSPAGKRLLTFNPLNAVNSTSPIDIPCNQCMGCRLERSRQWAVRMTHESKLYEQNCFLTLTYDEQVIPHDYSLKLRHLQLFIKRLRKSLPQKIRFFACGEYGDQLGRPHYHAIIFNHQFPDLIFFKLNPKTKEKLYTSTTLTNLWQMGHCTTGSVTFKSAAYVARYTTKKINGDRASDHYYRLSPVDGQFHNRKPEFAVMSRRPGIGHGYIEQFKNDFYPSGFIVVNGVPQAPPKYYISKLKEEEQTRLKRQARRRSLRHKEHNTTERRLAKAAVRDARITKLKRELG